MRKYAYFDNITDYIDGKTDSFIKIRMIGSKSKILHCLKEYIKFYPRRKEEILKIIDNIDNLLLSTVLLPQYIYNITSYLNEEMTFRELRDYYTKPQLLIYLGKYKKMYPDKADLIDNIIINIDEYYMNSRKVPAYVQLIDAYLEGKKSFNQLKFELGYKSGMIKKLELYKKKYPEKSDKIDFIINNVNKIIDDNTSTPKYIRLIDEYIKENNDINLILAIGTNHYIYDRLNCYLKLKPEYTLEVEKIKDRIKSLNDEKPIPKYEMIINQYINGLVSIDEIKNIGDKKYVLWTFKRYIEKHPDSSKYLAFLINNIDELFKCNTEEEKVVNLTHIDMELYRKNTAEVNKKILDDAFYSSLSIEEYCSITGISIDRVKKNCIKYIKSNDPDKVQVGTSLLERSPYTFLQRLRNDCLLNLLREDTDIFDYLNITRLQARDFREIMMGLIPQDKVVQILSNIDLYRLDPYNNKHIDKNKTCILNGKFVLNGIEATEEDKINVLNYLEENNYPLGLFNAALKKYLNGKLIIDSKKYIKK